MPASPKKLRVGLAGLGNVGLGVAKILLAKNSPTATSITLQKIAVKNKNKTRGISIPENLFCDNPLELATSPDIDVVVELIGGADGVALELANATLKTGKIFVTANKALIAKHGLGLAKLSEKYNASLHFEGAVAGGIPIIKTLKEGLSSNRIISVTGILNGTCNYILSAMESAMEGGKVANFSDVLKIAQEKGYAEADPSFDIEGIDASHKLAILSAIAFSTPPNVDGIYVEGITKITREDFEYAKKLGYRIRLLGSASKTSEGILQRVHPCFVPETSSLASVTGVLNAVMVESEPLGGLFLKGRGAGEGPTASAVVADIMDAAANRSSAAFGVATSQLTSQTAVAISNHQGAFYVRVVVKDKPGVLASITTLFSECGIGVDAVIQNANHQNSTAQIAFTTHPSVEANMTKVLSGLGKMEYVVEAPHMIRIEHLEL